MAAFRPMLSQHTIRLPLISRHNGSRAFKLIHNVQINRTYAGSSYGGGEGDPKGEDPSSQGPNPSADLEHPGPPPPDVGKGTGGGPTKASGGTESKAKGGSGAAQPKIHSENASKPTEQSHDVKKHNDEMANRHGAATNKGTTEDDKVDKNFWKGVS